MHTSSQVECRNFWGSLSICAVRLGACKARDGRRCLGPLLESRNGLGVGNRRADAVATRLIVQWCNDSKMAKVSNPRPLDLDQSPPRHFALPGMMRAPRRPVPQHATSPPCRRFTNRPVRCADRSTRRRAWQMGPRRFSARSHSFARPVPPGSSRVEAHRTSGADGEPNGHRPARPPFVADVRPDTRSSRYRYEARRHLGRPAPLVDGHAAMLARRRSSRRRCRLACLRNGRYVTDASVARDGVGALGPGRMPGQDRAYDMSSPRMRQALARAGIAVDARQMTSRACASVRAGPGDPLRAQGNRSDRVRSNTCRRTRLSRSLLVRGGRALHALRRPVNETTSFSLVHHRTEATLHPPAHERLSNRTPLSCEL